MKLNLKLDPYDAGNRSTPLLPVSADIGTGGRVLLVTAILTSIMQGCFVAIAASPFGKVWPAASSTTIDLPPYNPAQSQSP